jgi:putative hydrolase of the HAD superfamily
MRKTVPPFIKAIFFDVNGTLRMRELHAPTQRAAVQRMLALIGENDAGDEFWDELNRRHNAYRDWAQANQLQLSEQEIWTRWLLPDHSTERIGPAAAELTLAWSERKGRAIPRPGAEQTISELKWRGYRLGVISNTMSSLDVPRSLEAFGWSGYFEIVILSSAVKIRKPAPEIFRIATEAMALEPATCAYLGNRISKDVVGCKRAGFALGIVIENPGQPRADERVQTVSPDVVIHSLVELLDIFPLRGSNESTRAALDTCQAQD